MPCARWTLCLGAYDVGDRIPLLPFRFDFREQGQEMRAGRMDHVREAHGALGVFCLQGLQCRCKGLAFSGLRVGDELVVERRVENGTRPGSLVCPVHVGARVAIALCSRKHIAGVEAAQRGFRPIVERTPASLLVDEHLYATFVQLEVVGQELVGEVAGDASGIAVGRAVEHDHAARVLEDLHVEGDILDEFDVLEANIGCV